MEWASAHDLSGTDADDKELQPISATTEELKLVIEATLMTKWVDLS